jgi:hypothetical protein
MSNDDMGNGRRGRDEVWDNIGPVVPVSFPRPKRHPRSNLPPGMAPSQPEESAVRPSFINGDAAGTVGQTHKLRGFNRSISILSAKGDDRNPELVTIQIRAQTLDGGPCPYEVTASIGWGVGGARHDAKVSVGVGTQITLAATSLDISARLFPAFPGQPDPDQDVLISAVFASGSRPAQPPQVQSVVAGAAAIRSVFQVPPFARLFRSYSPVSLAGAILAIEGASSTPLSSIVLTDNAQAATGIILPPGSSDVIITPANNGLLLASFGLDLL